MSTLIRGGTVIVGDGVVAPRDAAVVIRDGVIAEVVDQWDSSRGFDGEVIDATGCVVMPGLINSHTHGVTPGPFMPSAASGLDHQTWMANLDRHLLAGTTTVLSQCGFSTMEDVAVADRAHAVHVKGATTLLPQAIEAARQADGTGLGRESALSTIERELEAGAIAIGELGGGQTLGGGGQDLVYIPDALEQRTGVRVTATQARELKDAALGRFLDVGNGDPAALVQAVENAGLANVISLDQLRELIVKTVMPSVNPAIEGIREGVRAAARFGVPAIVHSASATSAVMAELLGRFSATEVKVVAAHSNHPSHTPAEALAAATAWRTHGWAIEVSVFDLLHRKHTVSTREHWDVLLSEPGLVDVLATDYGSKGKHDELISAVQDVSTHGYRSLAGAVAMATSAVSDLIPGIAPRRGRLEHGWAADVVVADSADFRLVRHVLVDEIVVVRDGSLTAEAHR